MNVLKQNLAHTLKGLLCLERKIILLPCLTISGPDAPCRTDQVIYEQPLAILVCPRLYGSGENSETTSSVLLITFLVWNQLTE